ncbi:MAG TPA: IPT/TIG domain-containing protein [Gemmatimonadales bacterium]|nr:IPT/TIG domain-containing protein [Gemmatimonadales bacterium]
MTPETVLRDSSGGAHGFGEISLQSLDTAVVAVVFGNALIGVKPGLARLAGTAFNAPLSDTVTVRVVSADNLRLLFQWNYDPGVVPNYSRLPGLALLRDTSGNPPPSAHVVTLSSSDTSIARISPASVSFQDTTPILLTYGRPGLAVITARFDSLSTTRTVISDNVPVSQVSMAARPPRVMQVGDTVPVIVSTVGADFSARFYPVTWTTSNSARVRLDPEGTSFNPTGMVARLTALSPGQVTIRASSGGHTDTAVVTIGSQSAPVIAAAGPLPLTPGTTATITGSGYDANPVNDSVSIDGVPVAVTGATSTSLTLALPDREAFRCTPTHEAVITVSVGGALAVDSVPLQVGYPLAPDAGGTARAPAGTSCVELATVTGQAVWIAIANAASSPDALASFQVSGAASWASTPVPVNRPVTTAAPLPGTSFQGLRLDSLVTITLAHRRHLEAEAALMRHLGSPAQQWAAARAAGSSGPVRSIGARIGDTVLFHVPHIDRPDFCSSYDAIEARRVYTGTHAQIFEDVASPVAGQMDSVFAAVGREYDTLDYPVLLTNFGDPLVLDQLLSGVGKITMVFSPSVNQSGALGFVTGCDFYPESVAPSSNVTEVFYGPVPTSSGTGFGSFTPDAWKWEIRSALIHESKHIASFAAHLAQRAPPEETWLEEGSAVLAEELWSRTFYGTHWKGNAGYRQTLYCDVRPTFPECTGRPYSMFNAFAFLYEYAAASESHSPLGPTAFGDASFYGSSWSLLRWAIDQYAGSETQFIRALVQEPALTGVANLEARTGQSFARLSADWQLTLRSDGLGGFTPLDPTVTLPSWDLRNIYAGMNQDFPSTFPTDFPEQTRDESMAGIGSGTFNETVTGLPGGTSVTLFPTNVGAGGIALHMQGPTGGTPPPLQIEVLRIN